MILTRRQIIGRAAALTGALTGVLTVPRFALAEIAMGEGATLTTLSDGYLVLPRSFALGGLSEDEVAGVLADHDLTEGEFEPECNLALFRDGTNTVLFDAGAGPDFMPSAGQLDAALDAAGLYPEDVTHLVVTHGHPDHVWGLLDDFGDPKFYNAAHLIGRAEWDYWTDPNTVDSIGEARLSFAVGAARRFEAIEGMVDFFDDGDEVLPGIAAVATYGHTPGHMSFEVRSGGQSVMVVGDAIANHHLAFARPGLPSGSDQDPETAAATRTSLLDRLASDRMAIAGFHLPGGGLGRVERAGDAYRFVGEI